jgi:hypothetical protein
MVQQSSAHGTFVTEWEIGPDLPARFLGVGVGERASLPDRCRFPVRSPDGNRCAGVISVVAPDLFDPGVRRTQVQERAVVLDEVAKHLQSRGGSFDRENARVLDLRVITPSDTTPDEVNREWLYIVVAPGTCVVVSPSPSMILERAFPACGVGLIDTSPVAVALRLITVLNEGTAETLDTLERAATQILDQGGLSTEEQVARIPKFSRSIRYIARRLTEEKAAIEELRRLVIDLDLGELGIVDRNRLSSALTAQEQLVDTHSETADLALGALAESLRVAQWRVEDGVRKANVELQKSQLAEVDAQRSSNSYAYMMTILGGVTVPVALALGYVQSFQLTGAAADLALYTGITVSGALLTLLKPMYRWLKGNGKAHGQSGSVVVPRGDSQRQENPGANGSQLAAHADADRHQLGA